jgi:aminoglycoside 6'-N-acetyltransferase I
VVRSMTAFNAPLDAGTLTGPISKNMAIWKVRLARGTDRTELSKMRTLLWPDSPPKEHLAELDVLLSSGMSGTMPMVILVAEDQQRGLTGFLEVGLRSHADGCSVVRPVAFVEGWYVQKPFRKRGIGKALIRAAEEWARAKGCLEMASDALIDNTGSQRAHEALGFEVVDRCVHFRKQISKLGATAKGAERGSSSGT